METIAEVLLDYAAPFLDVESGLDEEEMEAAMDVVIAIWNASVLDAREGTGEHVRELRVEFEADGWPPREIVDEFVQRKIDDFPRDLRLVDYFGVRTADDGEVVFHAEEHSLEHGDHAVPD